MNVALNLALVRVAGFRGLALGTAIAATLNAALLLWLLRGRIGGLEHPAERARVRADHDRVAADGTRRPGARTTASKLRCQATARSTGRSACSRPSRWRIGVLVGVARVLHIEEFKEALARVASRLGMS